MYISKQPPYSDILRNSWKSNGAAVIPKLKSIIDTLHVTVGPHTLALQIALFSFNSGIMYIGVSMTFVCSVDTKVIFGWMSWPHFLIEWKDWGLKYGKLYNYGKIKVVNIKWFVSLLCKSYDNFVDKTEKCWHLP